MTVDAVEGTSSRRQASAEARRPRRARPVLTLPFLGLVLLAAAAAGIVSYLLLPTWPSTPVGLDAPAIPVTVGGVLFNVPPAAIRVPLQHRPGAQDRVDLAFLWPSLQPPDPAARPAPAEQAPPIDRIFITIEPQSTAVAPNDRVRTIYPRYLAETQFDGPDGLKVIAFKEGTPYRGEDLYFDPAAQPGFVVRCSRPGKANTPGMCLYDRRIEQADVTVRFPIDWLANWRGVNDAIATLLGQLRPGG
jgi:hypothetical protein